MSCPGHSSVCPITFILILFFTLLIHFRIRLSTTLPIVVGAPIWLRVGLTVSVGLGVGLLDWVVDRVEVADPEGGECTK